MRFGNGCPIEAESEFLGDIVESDVYFGIQVRIAGHSAKISGSAEVDPLAKFGCGNFEKFGFCIVGMFVAQFGVIYLFIIEEVGEVHADYYSVYIMHEHGEIAFAEA